MMLRPPIFSHDGCACTKRVDVGSRYQYLFTNYATDENEIWLCTVEAVDPLPNNKFFCRRAHVVADNGRKWSPFVPQIFAGKYRAVDNVVDFKRAAR